MGSPFFVVKYTRDYSPARELTRDAAFNRDTDRHIWAAHYLTAMSKAVVDDAVKVLERPVAIKP